MENNKIFDPITENEALLTIRGGFWPNWFSLKLAEWGEKLNDKLHDYFKKQLEK